MNNFLNSDKKIFPGDFSEEIKFESRQMSKVFFAFIGAYVLAYVIVLSCAAFMYAFDSLSSVRDSVLSVIQLSMMPLVCVFMIIFSRRIPSVRHPVMDRMTPAKLLSLLFLSVFVMMVGNLVGIYVNDIIANITGESMGNVVEETISQMSVGEVFVSAVIFAPVFEELVFRKLFIDKLSKYGTSFCITMSGLMFGLVHCNFEQFFYAFWLGSVFAYVYCIYGKIIYPIILHMIINAIGSIVPLLLGLADSSEYASHAQMAYIFAYIIAVVIGGVVYFVHRKRAGANYVSGVLIYPVMALRSSIGFYVALAVIITEFLFTVFG